MKILIVDDSEIARHSLEMLLHAIGYTDVLSCSSAHDALNLLGVSDKVFNESFPVDLILMDVIMPEMNGIEAISHIRAVHQLKDIPIIMVSISGEISFLERAFAAGATDFISKPINAIELSARVRAAFRLKLEMDIRKEREQQLEVLNRTLAVMCNIDNLTGIANRRCFDDALAKEWEDALRSRQPISMLLVDIDVFKEFNDTYGHVEGDACLQQVAKALRDSVDTPGACAARFGGEEFVILLPNVDQLSAEELAASIHAKIAHLQILHSASKVANFVTVSIGLVSVVPESSAKSLDMLKAADNALYAAKQQGRNRTVTGSPVLAMN